MEETISLFDLIKVLRKRILLILGITMASTFIAAIITFYFMKPIYEASTQILVNQKQNEQRAQIQIQDIQANIQLINTYSVIIKSPFILNKVIENLKLNITPSELSKQITVSNANNSQVVNISVENEQASLAVSIANSVAEVFQSEIKKIMNVDNVSILSPAVMPKNPKPVKPNKLLNITIGFVMGLATGILLSFLREYLDTTVKTEQDVEELLKLPILGVINKIPDFSEEVKELQKSRRAIRRERMNV